MYANWLANAAVAGATLAAHHGRERLKVLYAIFSVIGLHVAEIWIFALVMALLLLWPECGGIAGAASPHLFDYVYLSAMTFTTVGFGDVAPRGPIRFLSGTEALTGFVLIAWSASFTYLEMERFWKER